MKKLLIVSNLILLSIMTAMLAASCGPDPDPNQGGGTNNASNNTTTSGSCYTPANGAGFPGLNAMLVYHLAKNYRDHQLAAINATSPFDASNSDARSVWFDLETLKRFIYMIESKTCNNCSNSPAKKLGVRIYYGTYPTAAAWDSTQWQAALEGVSPAYAGRHTVMLVPTYQKTNADGSFAEVDFDPNYITDGCNFTNIESFYDSLKTNPPSGVTLTVLSSINGTAQNHGQMIPPPYDNNQRLDKGAGIMFAVDQVQ